MNLVESLRDPVKAMTKAGCKTLMAEAAAKIDELNWVIQTHAQIIPVPMLLWCPACGARHVDEGEFAIRVHHTHACQECGMVWRPCVAATSGVQFLPNFKNKAEPHA